MRERDLWPLARFPTERHVLAKYRPATIWAMKLNYFCCTDETWASFVKRFDWVVFIGLFLCKIILHDYSLYF